MNRIVSHNLRNMKNEKEEKSEYDEKAEAFMEKYGWTIKVEPLDYETAEDLDGRQHMTYRVTIRKKGSDGRRRGFTIKFHASIADPNRCTPYDVLTCLQKSDPGTLEEFVTEYGYEIKGFKSFNRARRIHAACTRAWKNVKRLCETEEELEALWEIC